MNPFRLLFVDFSKRGVLPNQPAHRTLFAAYLRLRTRNIDAVCIDYIITDRVVTYLFHGRSPDGDRHPSILLCRLLAVTGATKLTLAIALDLKSKLTLERGTKGVVRC